MPRIGWTVNLNGFAMTHWTLERVEKLEIWVFAPRHRSCCSCSNYYSAWVVAARIQFHFERLRRMWRTFEHFICVFILSADALPLMLFVFPFYIHFFLLLLVFLFELELIWRCGERTNAVLLFSINAGEWPRLLAAHVFHCTSEALGNFVVVVFFLRLFGYFDFGSAGDSLGYWLWGDYT